MPNYDDASVNYNDPTLTYDGDVFPALYFSVGGVDRTNEIDWRSIRITEAITKEPDTCDFRLRNYGTKTYRPTVGDPVTVFLNGYELFGGTVLSVDEAVEGMLKYITVKCNDYAQLLDRYLANESYTGQTANAIIQDLIGTYCPGFTTQNVDAPDTIPDIQFAYLQISQCLQQIATQLGDYDWDIDFDKDIHFFQKTSLVSPFDLEDDNGNMIWNSLTVSIDISQLRNHIIVVGNGGTIVREVTDATSIAEYGTFQFLVTDNSIATNDQADQRGQAELDKYAYPITNIQFKTYSDGLHAGQYINLNSVIRGINQDFQIKKVASQPHNNRDKFVYTVEASSAEKVILNDVLKKLVVVDPTQAFL